MKKSLWISAALAAAATVAAVPAVAMSSASATISGFSITLYDLDPSDSNAAELTFTSEGSSSYASVFSDGESDSHPDWQAGNFVPTSATAMLAFGHAHAETDASGATAMGHVSGPVSGGIGSFSAIADGVSSEFTLAPWSGMKLTLTFNGTASTGPGTGSDDAGAYGQLSIYVQSDSGWENHNGYREVFASCGAWDGTLCSGESNSFSGTFSLSFANFSDDAVSGLMYAEASAYGQSAVPVPEPQTYLMLLAGLAGVGTVVRRRRAG
jgi:hypothetical protein